MPMEATAQNRVKYRTACPQCRKNGGDRTGDNLIVYTNEGAHCFACGYHENPPDSLENMKAKVIPIQRELRISIPEDATNLLPLEPLQWLMSYKLTVEEIKRYDVMWSPRLKFLIFPFYDGEGNMIFWNARNFNTSGTKYKTVGPRSEYAIQLFSDYETKRASKEVVVCEDMVSAIKIARHMDCLPMLGAELNLTQVTFLAKNYHRLILWGDRDKSLQNCKKRADFSQYFDCGAGMIISTKDPKEYNDEQIVKFIDQQRGGTL